MESPGTAESAAPGGREPAVMSVRGAAIWAIAGQYVSFALLFTLSVIISRFFLTPAEVGLFSIGLAVALLVAILQDFGLSRYISGLPSLDAEEIARCSTIAHLGSLVIAGIIAAAAWPLAHFYDQPKLAPILLVIALSYLFVPFSIVPMALMGRRMQFKGHFAVNVGGALAQTIVALGLAAAGYSSFALAWGAVASNVARGLIAQIGQRALPWPLRLDGLAPVLRFGSSSSGLYLIGALGSRTPDLIIGKALTVTAVGLYSRASNLSDQFRQLISGAIGSVFYPAFARIRDRGEPLGPAYLRVCAGYSAIIWPGMAGLALAAEPLVRLLYGDIWIRTAPLLTMISLTEIILISLPLVSELPILLGKINRLIVFSAIDTSLSVGLLMIGCQWGVEGAAASRLVYAVAWMCLYAGFMHGIVRFDVAALARIYAKSALSTLAAIAPLALTYAVWIGPSEMGFGTLLLAVAAGGVCWLATLWLVKHPAMAELLALAESLPFARHLPLSRRSAQ